MTFKARPEGGDEKGAAFAQPAGIYATYWRVNDLFDQYTHFLAREDEQSHTSAPPSLTRTLQFSLPQMTFKVRPEGGDENGAPLTQSANTYTSYWRVNDVFDQPIHLFAREDSQSSHAFPISLTRTLQFSLPQMTFKARPEGGDENGAPLAQPADTYTTYWRVNDVFDFDNVGVSREVVVNGKTVKYLTCADCEIGPIGWYWAENKGEIFLCKDERVLYD